MSDRARRPFDCEKQLQLAEEAAIKAGRLILEMRGFVSALEKSSSGLVTEADMAAQEVIVKTLRSAFPNHGIIAEEGDLKAERGSDHLWVIDPLDGTNNYAHGIPHYSVSIAYAYRGRVLAGVVYDPLRDEMFSALRGGGASLNGLPIFVSRTPLLSKAIVATGFYYDRGEVMRKTLKSIEKLFSAGIHGIRRFGSAALDICWVACGRFDAYFEYRLSPWDFAAGILIAEEAGGRCTDSGGEPADLDSTGLVVSNGLLHQQMLALVG